MEVFKVTVSRFALRFLRLFNGSFALGSYIFCKFTRKTDRLSAKITCVCARMQYNLVFVNKIFGWKSFLSIILPF